MYSTRGGTSGKTLRVCRPLFSIEREFAVSTFCEIPPREFLSCPNLLVPSNKSRMINTFHLSLMRVKVVSTGHAVNYIFHITPYFIQ